ncbi:hypothetical protein E2562_034297 [Oryza meyeriana var. granulata]|uniref:Uncharacterized protein n=1 Tax=Oryza meyeriana var. granulata TaxID=110450 RepID=A0A6G1FEZ0_9ORYZ|nr:hypothetical protein E2562_034297 [Oryza meyeriana var. granulata]
MGGCFSSTSSPSEEAGQHVGGGYRPRRRVRPSDEDGKWPCAGRRTVDHEADVYIAKFHQYQSNCWAEHMAAPPTPAAPA